MQDINISTIIGSTVPVEEQLKLIKNAGFDGFFLTYTGIEPLVSWAETAYQLGLKFETIHGPFSQANRIWEAGDIGKDYPSPPYNARLPSFHKNRIKSFRH